MIEISEMITIVKKIHSARFRFNESHIFILCANASCHVFKKSIAGTRIIKLSLTNVLKSKKKANNMRLRTSARLLARDRARKYKDTLIKSIHKVSLMQF